MRNPYRNTAALSKSSKSWGKCRRRRLLPLTADLLWLETGDVREAILKGVDPLNGGKFIDWKKRLLRQKDRDRPPDFNVPGFPDANGVWVGVNIVAEPNEKTDKYDLDEIRRLIGQAGYSNDKIG